MSRARSGHTTFGRWMSVAIATLYCAAICSRALCKEVELQPLDEHRSVLNVDGQLFVLDVDTAVLRPLCLANKFAVDSDHKLIMAAINEVDHSRLLLFDASGQRLKALMDAPWNEVIFGVTATHRTPDHFCVITKPDAATRRAHVAFVHPRKGPATQPATEVVSSAVPVLDQVSHLISFHYLIFSDDAPQWCACNEWLTDDAPSHYDQLKMIYPEGLPLAFLILNGDKIQHAWPNSLHTAIAPDAMVFRKPLAFHGGEIFVQLTKAKDHPAHSYYIIDAASGGMKPCDFMGDDLVVAVNDGMDAAIGYGPVDPDRNESAAPQRVRLVRRASTPIAIATFPRDTSVSAFFDGDRAVVTDGTLLWIVAKDGKVTERRLTNQ